MHFAFTKQVALGVGAALIVVTVATAAILSLPKGPIDPAAHVPAAETIALFTNLTTQNNSALSAHIQELSQVTLTDIPSTVALLKTGSGLIGWAILEPTLNPDQPFTIRTSDPVLASLFQGIQNPLSKQYSYRVLAGKPTSSPSAWLRFPDISLSTSSPFATLLRTDTPVAISPTADGLTLRMNADAFASIPALGTGPKELFAEPLFILHTSNGNAFLDTLSGTLRSDTLLIPKTLLRSALTTLFGKDLSPAYDLPPLLEGTTTLEIAKGNSNTFRVFLEGEIPNDEKALDHLTDLFLGTLATANVYTQTFDEKFNWQDIRQDESLIEDTTRTENGWTIRTMRQTKTGTLLLQALRGNRYILSNDTDAMQKAIHHAPSSLAGVDDVPVGLGLIRSADWNDFLSRSLPTLSKGAMTPAGPSGHLKWKMEQKGRVLTIVLKKI